jgi:hypothetical protein
MVWVAVTFSTSITEQRHTQNGPVLAHHEHWTKGTQLAVLLQQGEYPANGIKKEEGNANTRGPDKQHYSPRVSSEGSNEHSKA